MKKQKIAIIGAGICGLYLGWKLSEKGHLVSIFEKKREIGDKVCSGLFSERILGFIPQSRSLIQNTINSVILHFPGKTITIKFSKKFYVMSHTDLNKLMENLAQKAGVKINLNHNISALSRKANSSSPFINGEEFDKVIGCDGANSFVRKELNLPELQYRLGILGFLEEKSNLNFVEAWPCQKGFLWKIPRGAKIEYGIIADSLKAKIIFDKFLKKNNIQLAGIRSRIIPQGFAVPFSSSITLCGDAAGLTKPWSGGGVVWGLTAAEILLKTFPDFLNYHRRMKRFFLPRIAFSKIIVKIIYYIGFKTPFLLPKKVRMESDFLL